MIEVWTVGGDLKAHRVSGSAFAHYLDATQGVYGTELEALDASLAAIDAERERLAGLRERVVQRRMDLWEEAGVPAVLPTGRPDFAAIGRAVVARHQESLKLLEPFDGPPVCAVCEEPLRRWPENAWDACPACAEWIERAPDPLVVERGQEGRE